MKPRFGVLLAISCLLSPISSSQGLSGIKICIDPGHGGFGSNDRHLIPDPGVDFYESESNFRKALHLKGFLEERGAIVILTRYSNSGVVYENPIDPEEPSLSARVATANANNVDWFHSIHSNAGGANYTLMLVREQIVVGGDAVYGPGTGQPEWPQAWQMSLLMAPTIRSYMRTTDARVFRDWTFYGGANGGYTLGVLRGLIMPGELSEGSFHDFTPETRRLMNNDYRKMEAWALLRSFATYFEQPPETLGIVAGILTNYETSQPINGVVVRLSPEGRVYTVDNYKNGFFMFDSLTPGARWIRFEAPGFLPDSTQVNVTSDGPQFADRQFFGQVAAKVTYSLPRPNDTTFSVDASIGVIFSRPMDTATTRAAFSLTPFVTGSFSWSNANKTLLFKPALPLPSGQAFVLKVDTTATTPVGVKLDAAGLGYPNPFIVNFRTAGTPTDVHDDGAAPMEYQVLTNYPNPFNPATTITLELPFRTSGSLVVYDAAGREVARLLDGELAAGTRTIRFDAAHVPSGVYLCELRTAEFRSAIKLMLLK